MNKDYEIYRAPEDSIPIEDKARLDGFLEGRAEAVALEKAQKKLERSMTTSIKEK